jgi:hypothetical protein
MATIIAKPSVLLIDHAWLHDLSSGRQASIEALHPEAIRQVTAAGVSPT